MNNRDRRIAQQLRKKLKKEVYSGQYQNKYAVAEQPSIRNLRGQNPAQPPKKAVKKIIGNLEEMRSSMYKKKAARANPMKESKRTSPGEIPKVSAPRSPHMEGERWAKNSVKQSVLKSKRLAAKMRK